MFVDGPEVFVVLAQLGNFLTKFKKVRPLDVTTRKCLKTVIQTSRKTDVWTLKSEKFPSENLSELRPGELKCGI